MNPASTSPQTTSSQSADALAEIFGEISERIQAGQPVDVEEYARDYPEFAEQLRQLLPTMTALNELGFREVAEQIGQPEISTSSESTAAQSPVRVLGDFRIVREIGRGGMGVVYEAEQISLGRHVALKVLPFAAMLNQTQLTRFKNEARAAATLKHANIVSVHSVGTDRGVHFYAMELIEGMSLAEVIVELRGESQESRDGQHVVSRDAPAERVPQDSPFPIPHSPFDTDIIAALSTIRTTNPKQYYRRVAELGIQAARALDHAHQHGIIHRDIKPGNLMLDADGKLLITDFGLARIGTDASMTTTGDLVGTLRYMSPEQALAKRGVVDHRSDIYSLGITLYELATLTPTFTGNDREELLRQIAQENPKPPRQIDTNIPRNLETVLLKSIAKEPAARYESAADLADDLQRFDENQPITARRQSRISKALHWARRNRTVAALSSLALLLVLTLAIGGPIVAVQQRELANRMQELAQEASTERDLAKESLRRNRELVDGILTPAAAVIRFASQDQELTDKIVREQVKFYRAALVKSQNDISLRLGLADALSQLAQTEIHLGGDAASPRLEAIEIYQNLVAEFPNNLEYRRRLHVVEEGVAYYYYVVHRFSDAAKMIARSVAGREQLFQHAKAVPSDKEALAGAKLVQARITVCNGHLLHAEAQFRHGLEMLADTPRDEGHYGYVGRQEFADLLMMLGEYEEAAVYLEQTRRITLASLSNAENATKRTSIRFWIAFMNQRMAAHSLQTGDLQKAEQHVTDAIELMRQLDRELPQVFWAKHMLGEFHYTRAEVYLLTDRLDEAADEAREMIRFWYRDNLDERYKAGLARWLLGEILFRQRQFDAAKSHFIEARRNLAAIGEARPDEPVNNQRFIVFLGNCCDETFRDSDRAVQIAQRVVTDTDGPMWRYLALAQYRAGDYTSAETSIRRSMNLRSGGDALDRLLLTAILHRDRRHDEANDAYVEAIRAISDAEPIHYGYIGAMGYRRLREEVERLRQQ